MITNVSVRTVELVRLQRMLEAVRENPILNHAKLAQAHELIDGWLIDPARKLSSQPLDEALNSGDGSYKP